MGDIEILESLPSLYPLQDYEEEAIINVCKMLEDIKTLQRPRGVWIVGSDEYSCFGKYCPSCGADMRGEGE